MNQDEHSAAVSRVSPLQWLAALGDSKHPLQVNRDYLGHHPDQRAWRGPWRIIDDHVVYLVLNGAGGVTAGRKLTPLREGVCLWVPPRLRHQFHWSRGFSFYNLRFRLLEGRTDLCFGRRPMVVGDARDLRRLFDQIIGEVRFPLPYHEQRMRGLLLLLGTAFLRLRRTPARARPSGVLRQTLRSAQSQRLSQYVREHLLDHPRPKDLARELRLSPDYFSRLFRQTFGLPPRQWLVRERVRLAAQRLAESNLSISEVAYEFGYETPAFFSRQFKQVMGQTPQAFRRRQQE